MLRDFFHNVAMLGNLPVFESAGGRGESNALMYAFFIRRPVVAMCVALMLVLSGLITAFSLPVAQYPDIVPAEVSISTSFPGADCETVVDSVASPIEQQMSGVEGMEYMTSTSTNDGNFSLSVVFEIGSSADMDQVLSYLRYAQATAQLPQEVQQMGVTMRTLSGPPMLLYVLRAPQGEYDAAWLSNYAYINFVNPLLRTQGVGNVQVFGAGEYAMRIWLNPQKMAALGISVQQVQNAISAQNRVNPVGKIGAAPALPGQQTDYTVRTQGRLRTVGEFRNIILRADADALVRLGDVARVELGCQTYNMSSSYNGGECAIIAISQSPGSNALETVRRVENTLAGLNLAPGLELKQALNTTAGVSAGIEDILVTLGIALVLVMVVVFIFLQGWRAMLIPLAAIPVSIVGTFLFFPVFGMEVNTICLMGLVLAIGLVVDDAIVVVEAVQARIDMGDAPPEATASAMKEVAGPVVATALVLAAVFFPCMLLPGITGKLFAQFSVTIGVSIVLSALTALVLSPALAAMLLRPRKEGSGMMARCGHVVNAWMQRLRVYYTGVSHKMIRHGALTGLVLLACIACIYPVAQKVPDAFLPNEDEGYFYGSLQLPQGAALDATERGTRQVVDMLLQQSGIDGVLMVNGFDLITGVQSSNNAFFFVALKPWAERKLPAQSAAALAADVAERMNTLNTGGIGFTMVPPPIPGVGATSAVTFMLEDRAGRGPAYLAEQTSAFIAAASRCPQIAAVQNMMAFDAPQYFLKVDVEKALSQGVDPDAVYRTLQAFLGSSFVNYFNDFGYQYPVYMQADAPFRMQVEQLNTFYLPAVDGSQVPLDSLVQVRRSFGPQFMLRQNMYNAAMLNVSAAPGYTAQQAMDALEDTFARCMPQDMGYSYSGMSYQEQKAAQGVSLGAIFALSGVFTFLLLAALYESWSLPWAIGLSVPIAILGAFVALWITGMPLNLYAKIGLIMLTGLAAKNAILVVEFAQNRRAEGMPLLQATLAGAAERLRPILMTSLAFILGCVPLALATGPGAVARQSVGITVIGGMCVATFVGIFFIPFCYYCVARLRR